MQSFLIINGPNLNMLGQRESVYGDSTLEEIQKNTELLLKSHLKLDWFQSNDEAQIVAKIQNVNSNIYNGLIINPGAYSHSSIAIRDALKTLDIPIAEIHLSQLYQREDFRQRMLTAEVASIIMTGLKEHSYYHAALALLSLK